MMQNNNLTRLLVYANICSIVYETHLMQARKLTDLAKIGSGYPFRGKVKAAVDSDASVVQMKDVANDLSVNWDTCVKSNLTGKKKPEWLEHQNILLASRGSHNYAVYIDETISSIKAVAAPHFFVIKADKARIKPEYLVWYLNQLPAQHYFAQNAEGSQTKSIRRALLEGLEVSVPSLTEQHKVIQLTQNIKQQNHLAQQLIQSNLTLERFVAMQLANSKNHNKQL